MQMCSQFLTWLELPAFGENKLLWPQSWSSLVEGDEACIGPSGKLLCLWKIEKNWLRTHGIISYMLDHWADPVVHLLLLKSSMLQPTGSLHICLAIGPLQLFISFCLRASCHSFKRQADGRASELTSYRHFSSQTILVLIENRDLWHG